MFYFPLFEKGLRKKELQILCNLLYELFQKKNIRIEIFKRELSLNFL